MRTLLLIFAIESLFISVYAQEEQVNHFTTATPEEIIRLLPSADSRWKSDIFPGLQSGVFLVDHHSRNDRSSTHRRLKATRNQLR